ncbi:MAG TPA: hypothetical protein VJB87_01285 [Candidatus Nanoarchaeia archaeon]|nr:hypothetical protein [Candidatus Nanoarchaeia archaeon]
MTPKTFEQSFSVAPSQLNDLILEAYKTFPEKSGEGDNITTHSTEILFEPAIITEVTDEAEVKQALTRQGIVPGSFLAIDAFVDDNHYTPYPHSSMVTMLIHQASEETATIARLFEKRMFSHVRLNTKRSCDKNLNEPWAIGRSPVLDEMIRQGYHAVYTSTRIKIPSDRTFEGTLTTGRIRPTFKGKRLNADLDIPIGKEADAIAPWYETLRKKYGRQ